MDMQTMKLALAPVGVPVYDGYAATDARLPYIVQRPLILDPLDVALDGSAIDWDHQFAIYACGASVEASFNLGQAIVRELQGKRAGGEVLSASFGYAGAQVEGHYETQVTVQSNQGEI